MTRYRRDYHSEDARERAQEDADLEEAAQHPFRGYVTTAVEWERPGIDRRLFGRDEADNPAGDAA